MDFSSILNAIPEILDKIEEPIGVISLIVILFSVITWAFFGREGAGYKVFAILLLFLGCAGVAFAVLQPEPPIEQKRPPQTDEVQEGSLTQRDDVVILPHGSEKPVMTAEQSTRRTAIIVGPDGEDRCEYSSARPEGGIDVDDLRSGTGWIKIRDYHPDRGWFSTTLVRNEDGETVEPPNPFSIMSRSGQFREISYAEMPSDLLGRVIRVSDGLLLRERPFPALNDGENSARFEGTIHVCVQYVSYDWEHRETVAPCLPNQPCEPFVPEDTDVWLLVSIVE